MLALAIVSSLRTGTRANTGLGEPPFITIRVINDGFIEVDVETFSGRQGSGGGWSLSEAVATAVDCLLALAEFAPCAP